ncbi:MAG: hypothetical protein ABL901_00825 [Hyphomicrobiaceae bacterium]
MQFLKRLFGGGGKSLGRQLEVPAFDTYYPSPSGMSGKQLEFYGRMLKGWETGKPIPVDGKISYVFALSYHIINQDNKTLAADELGKLVEVYGHEPKIAEYCNGWRADCFVAIGEYAKALSVFPAIPVNGRSSMQTDRLLSLKAKVGAPLMGRDVLTLFGPKVTAYAKKHVEQIAQYIDVQLEQKNQRDGDVLQSWCQRSATRKGTMGLFSGVPTQHTDTSQIGFNFSLNPEVEAFCKDVTREAENTLREDEGMPRVGEGWIEETRLHYALRDALHHTEVVQHARLEWLGYQHLDVYIPKYNVGLEFQGAQHDGPVEFFGGEEAFRKVKERDARKRKLCRKHGIYLIEVRAGYVLEQVLAEIESNKTCR